jgi:hypothetical protein
VQVGEEVGMLLNFYHTMESIVSTLALGWMSITFKLKHTKNDKYN